MNEYSPMTIPRILIICLSIFPLIILLSCCNIENGIKPNILFIMSDDHTTQAFGIYGSRLASLDPTPNLDQLAKEGVVFDNVFCTNSICTPSRAVIITGQYPQTNGVLDLMGSIPPESQYLPIEIKKLGYQTAMIGKWHLEEEPAAFDYYNVLPGQGKYHNPPTLEKGKGEWPKNIIKHEGHSSDVITDISLDWLKNRDKSQPFFLMHHFKAPHDLFSNAERYDDYLEDVEIPEPGSLYNMANHGSVSTRGINDSLIHVIGASVSKRCDVWGLGREMGISDSINQPEYTHEVYQEFLKRYLRCVKGVDYEDPPRTDYWGSQADIITPPGWEFYDLEKDPKEMNNLYGDPEYADIIADLKIRLKSTREELNETDKDYSHIQKIIYENWD